MENYPLVAGPKVTKLTTTYDPAHDNVICVESIDSIPKPPNHVTIFDLNEHCTTVSYDYVGNNKISGLKVIEGDEKHIYKIGDYCVRTIDKYDFDALINEIDVLKKSKLNRYQGRCKSGDILVVDGDGMIKTTEPTQIASAWGKISGNINEQTDLIERLDEKLDIRQGTSKQGQVLKVNNFGDVDAEYIRWGEIAGSIASQADLVTELNKKLNNQYPLTELNKVLKINSSGQVVPDFNTYTDLINKPKINGIEVAGEKTGAELKLLDLVLVASTKDQCYSKRMDGTQYMQDISYFAEPLTVVRRGNRNEIRVNETPIQPDEAVSKSYADTKVSANQGVAEAGKFLKVDVDGKVKPMTSASTTVEWGNITGSIMSQPDLVAALAQKVTVDTGSVQPSFTIGVNAAGKMYISW